MRPAEGKAALRPARNRSRSASSRDTRSPVAPLCSSTARMRAVLEQSGATGLRVSRDEAERLRFRAGRKAAFPSAGRISPDYYCMDGTIPKKALGDMLTAITVMETKYGLRCINVFHAGDGNLHPLIL